MPRLCRRILVLFTTAALALAAATWAQAYWMWDQLGCDCDRWPMWRRFLFLLWPNITIRMVLFALLVYATWVCARTIRRMVVWHRVAGCPGPRACTACGYP